jgi:hypothetical protein
VQRSYVERARPLTDHERMNHDSSIQRIFDDIVPFPLLQRIIDMMSDEGIRPPKDRGHRKIGIRRHVCGKTREYCNNGGGGCRMAS